MSQPYPNEVPDRFPLNGNRSAAILGWLFVLMGAFVAFVGVFNKDLANLLGLVGAGVVIGGLGYLWQRWIRSKLIESVTLWSDRLEIRRGGIDETFAWADVEQVTNVMGDLHVTIRDTRGFVLLGRVEGNLYAIEMAFAKRRGRAGT